MDYKKTSYTSPMGVVSAKESKKKDGEYHIFSRSGNVILFYSADRNRFVPVPSSIEELSPEAMSDIANLGKSLYERHNP